MKVTDYIVDTLAKETSCVFGYPGGMVTHLMDSLYKNKNITTQICYNEQGAGFAACGYAATSGKLGVAFATSGPGATNLLTALCHAQFESLPVLFITGQVNTDEAKGDLPVRQKGFQETDIVSMVRNVTKYATYVSSAKDLPTVLATAIRIAKDGRAGAVLLDIPMNVQRAEVDISQIAEDNSNSMKSNAQTNTQKTLDILLENLSLAKKPLILAGNGLKVSGQAENFRNIVESLPTPIVSSMTAVDILANSENHLGFIGAYGHRAANIAVHKCDFLISFGSRLDCRQTGADLKRFAPEAKLLRFDIDENEFTCKVKQDQIEICADLRELMPLLARMVTENKSVFHVAKFAKWLDNCKSMQARLQSEVKDETPANEIVRKISRLIPEGAIITTDVGQNQVWVAQSFEFKSGQKMLTSGGHGAMGFSLPAAIGAYYATKRKVYAFTGDGGLQMNIQELQWLKREQIPVKVIVLNNNSLGMIRHFQEMYFESEFSYTVKDRGYTAPNFAKIAAGYDIRGCEIQNVDVLGQIDFWHNDEPAVFDVSIGEVTYVQPKIVFGEPLYNQEPRLPHKLLQELIDN
jgi:acetolactate synthase-1/2/3 large subunit